MDELTIGIYARKSVYRDNSDSVAVQVKSCKEYASLVFRDKKIKFQIYDHDEGFSGKNVNRPSYQELMTDVRNGKLNIVMVYKLDRISRSVKDFSETYETMCAHQVSFLSVKESFDTSTPIGRTVMYILAAFAQLERENTSERVADSMLALGLNGKWTGGKLPAGMSSIRKTVGEKEHSYLVVDPERIPMVKLLGEMFLSGYSITALERYCRTNNIKSESGKFLSCSQIHTILSNPVYCGADQDAYYYFSEKGCTLPEQSLFTGKYGLIAYGRTKQTSGTQKNATYPLAIGIHEPVFSGKEWVAIQNRFHQNLMCRTSKYEIGILKGTMKCSCGAKMEIKTYLKKGSTFSYYYCSKMQRQGNAYCDSGYVRVEKVDDIFLSELKKAKLNPESILLKKSASLPLDKKKLQKDLTAVNASIENLTSALMENTASTAASYIISKIEKLDVEKRNLETAIRKADLSAQTEKEEAENRLHVYQSICKLLDNFESMPYREKNELIKNTIKSCTFDGEHLSVTF